MAEIIKNYDPKSCVSNLKGHVSDDNQVTLYWDWPENEEYDLCVVYGLEREDETLEMLLKRSARRTIYSNEFGVCHKENIMASYVQFRVYPAKKVNGQLSIVDQKTKNMSPIFYKKVRIEYRIEYDRPKLLVGYRTARIRFLEGWGQSADAYLCYRCLGGRKGGLVYGIDLASFGGQNVFEIVVGKDETIELFLEEEQRNRLELIKR